MLNTQTGTLPLTTAVTLIEYRSQVSCSASKICLIRTVRIVDPILHNDRTDSVDDNDCVLVYTGNLLDKSILGFACMSLRDLYIYTDELAYPTVPGAKIVSVTCVIFDSEITLTEVTC